MQILSKTANLKKEYCSTIHSCIVITSSSRAHTLCRASFFKCLSKFLTRKLSIEDKITELLKVQGLDERDERKLKLYQSVMSLTNSLNNDLAKLYKTDITVEGGADKDLENIHAAQKKVSALNKVLEFEEGLVNARKDSLKRAKQFMKTTRAIEKRLRIEKPKNSIAVG